MTFPHDWLVGGRFHPLSSRVHDQVKSHITPRADKGPGRGWCPLPDDDRRTAVFGTRSGCVLLRIGFRWPLGIDLTPGVGCAGSGDPVSAPLCSDIIFGIVWSVELEPEVETWIESLSVKEFALVLAHVERLAERGNQLRMPTSRALGDKLYELRFGLNRVAWRITYFFAGPGRRIVLLTVFRKQRQNERAEVQRAREVMARCVAEGHMAEEDDG